MEKSQLEKFITDGYSVRGIAKQKGCGATTIRYWLKKYCLSTIKKAPNLNINYKCCRCGEVDPSKFYGNKKTICSKCHNQYCKKNGWERKQQALIFMGGKCQRCGYSAYAGSLDFHHVDPTLKDPRWRYMRGWSWSKIESHLSGCVLLCSNCHREFHGGLFQIEESWKNRIINDAAPSSSIG